MLQRVYASRLQPDEKHERSLTLFAGLRGLAPLRRRIRQGLVNHDATRKTIVMLQ